jgi:hypothetical protein
MNLQKIRGMKFISGPYAKTDIHNGGSIFGIIYTQLLQFHDENKVTLQNRVLINRGMRGWQQAAENERWEGTYTIDDKHVKCELTDLLSSSKQTIYAAFASDELLISEVFEGERKSGKGKVFSKID